MTGKHSDYQWNTGLAIAFAIGVLLPAFVIGGLVVLEIANNDELGEYLNESEQWCNEHNGELVNSHAIMHGGLHCDLPNGTSVHMHEVIDT